MEFTLLCCSTLTNAFDTSMRSLEPLISGGANALDIYLSGHENTINSGAEVFYLPESTTHAMEVLLDTSHDILATTSYGMIEQISAVLFELHRV
jgi:hypothetical protein